MRDMTMPPENGRETKRHGEQPAMEAMAGVAVVAAAVAAMLLATLAPTHGNASHWAHYGADGVLLRLSRGL